jgi:adenylate cyclase
LKEVVYAVYCHQGGRWTRDRSFPSEQREDAKKAAEALLTRQGVLGVTLVEETFNPTTGETKEIGIWSKSSNASVPALGIAMRKEREKPAEAAPARSTDNDEEAAADEDIPQLVQRGVKPPVAGAPFLVVFKLLAAGVLALFVAGLISYGLAYFDLYGIFTIILDREGIQTKVFVGLFIVAVLLILPNVLSWREFSQAFQVAGAGGPRRPAQRPAQRSAPKSKAAAAKTGREEREARADSSKDKESAKKDATPNTAQPKGPPPPPELESDGGPEITEAKKSIITFFARCVDFLMKTSSQFVKGGKLSTFNQFGCDLFLAGAAEAYAERKEMAGRNKEIMAAVIRAAGRGNDRAAQFADKHENYLLEPRYLDMFRAGREAMSIYLKDEELRTKAASGELSEEDEASLGSDAEGDIGMFLENALDHWNSKGNEKKQQGGTVAVMFTSIIGAFSESTGDENTAKLLHAHNRIVRESLRMHGGTEVKQTNDGIMASFPVASEAVQAAVEIQKSAKVHSGVNQDLPLHVKIGINAGEPIAENNDLFGTPVQMAARVMAFAGQDQIAVSKLVFDLCTGKGLKFKDLGAAEFKGFAEKVPVYEAQWRDESEMLPE